MLLYALLKEKENNFFLDIHYTVSQKASCNVAWEQGGMKETLILHEETWEPN